MPISDFPGYEVSNHGQVRSFWKRQTTHGDLGKFVDMTYILSDVPQKILHPSRKKVKDKVTYLQVTLCKDGKHFYKSIHRLVLEQFIGPCPPGNDCCHNDGNGEHNDLINLRWDTKGSNNIDTLKHGHHNKAKLSESQVIQLRDLFHKFTIKELAAMFHISEANTRAIIKRQTWTYL